MENAWRYEYLQRKAKPKDDGSKSGGLDIEASAPSQGCAHLVLHFFRLNSHLHVLRVPMRVQGLNVMCMKINAVFELIYFRFHD